MKRNLGLLLIVMMAVSMLAIAQQTNMSSGAQVSKPTNPANVSKVATAGIDEITSSKSDYKYVGHVCELAKEMQGRDGKLTKDKAMKVFAKAQPLVLKTEKGKIYFVFNTDGSYAGKKLAAYAGPSLLGINGKLKKVNGMSIIIAEKMDKVK